MTETINEIKYLVTMKVKILVPGLYFWVNMVNYKLITYNYYKILFLIDDCLQRNVK